MELNMSLEGNIGLQNKVYDYSSAFSAPPRVKQADTGKTKAEPEKQEQDVNEQDTLAAVDKANELMRLFNRDLRFETHKETGIIQVSIVDRQDGKVVKQLPPDSILDMISKIRDLLGSLMDVTA